MLELLFSTAALWSFEASKDPFTDVAKASLYSKQGDHAILLTCESGKQGYSTVIEFGSYIGGWPIIRTGTIRVDEGPVFSASLIVAETSSRFAVAEGTTLGEKAMQAKKTIAVKISESNRGYGATAVFDATPDGKKADMFRKKCAEINP